VEIHSDQAGTGTRRAVLAGAGAAGVAALTGCDDKPARAEHQPPPSPSPPVTGIHTADIPVGSGKIFADLDDDGTVVTQPTAGRFLAFSATCTHRGCTLRSISDGTINCPCHGARYSIKDGSVVQPGDGIPAETKPLPPKQVTVSGDTLTVS
jgi:Rieske Fe-S protein